MFYLFQIQNRVVLDTYIWEGSRMIATTSADCWLRAKANLSKPYPSIKMTEYQNFLLGKRK